MARIPYRKAPAKVIASAALVAVFAAGAASWQSAREAAQTTVEMVEEFEGYVPQAYLDPVGILTKCYGDTTNVVYGRQYSFEECARSLNSHLAETTRPLYKAIPSLSGLPPKTQAAFASMAYNIGPGAFLKSSVAGHIRSGNLEKACRRISQIYKTAKGRELPGLVKRRKAESDLCLEGLREAQ